MSLKLDQFLLWWVKSACALQLGRFGSALDTEFGVSS